MSSILSSRLLWWLCLVSAWSGAFAQEDPFARTFTHQETPSPKPSEKDSLPEQNGNRTLDPEFDAFLQQEIEFSVPILTVEQLKTLRTQENNQLILLDARDANEYEVSHIEGARRVGYDDFSTERVWNLNRNATIVVYCAVGERSEEIGKRIKDMGFKKVYNLYGSLTEWVNQGNPVVDKKGRNTQKVHVHDKTRTRWLKRGKAVY